MLLAPELHYDKLRYLLALIISDNSGKLNPGKLKFREVTIDLSQDAQVLPPAEDARGDRAEPHPPEPLVVVGDVGRGDGALPLGDPLGPEAGRRYSIVDTFSFGISQVFSNMELTI